MKTDYSDIKWQENGRLKLCIIVGTRPEIIRLAAVINKCREYFDVILAHTGGWKEWDQVIELLTDPALYIDISFSMNWITQEQFMKILNQHGSDHMLFATDSPWDTAAHTLEELKKLPLSQEQMDDICYRTGSKILGFSSTDVGDVSM